MKNNKKTIFNSILLLIFLYLGFLVRNSAEGVLFDVPVLNFIHNSSNPIYIVDGVEQGNIITIRQIVNIVWTI